MATSVRFATLRENYWSVAGSAALPKTNERAGSDASMAQELEQWCGPSLCRTTITGNY